VVDIAAAAKVGIRLDEARIPLRDEVRGACELLGFDPLFIACEGRFMALLPCEAAEAGLMAVRSVPEGRGAAIVGEVVEQHPGRAILRTVIGSRRVLDKPSGEQLPRIC
jgi:hydrogenase expression/formation protein HypE